jgi:hypothetical protein
MPSGKCGIVDDSNTAALHTEMEVFFSGTIGGLGLRVRPNPLRAGENPFDFAPKRGRYHRKHLHVVGGGGRWQFTLLAGGGERVTKAQAPVTIVDPSAAAVPAVKTLHKFLAEFQGQVKICDPYFDR